MGIGEQGDVITLSKTEYEEMQERLRWLQALESAGVDNWAGVDFAKDIYHGRDY